MTADMAFTPAPVLAQRVLTVDESGAFVSPGGAGGGDANSANQETAIGHLEDHTSLLGQIDGRVDGLEAAVGVISDTAVITDANGTLSAKLRGLIVLMLTQNGHLDGLETLVTSSNTKLDTLNTRGFTVHSAVEITRPANTTAYAAKDAIADTGPTILTFTGCARTNGGSGYITKARLMTDQAANVAAYRLHLYDATLSAVADNAAQTVLYANRASYIGYIDFPAASTDGSDTANSQSTQAPLPFVASGTSLFGMLETLTAFTPASGQKFYIQLGIEQN